jgi:hypothetical protein
MKLFFFTLVFLLASVISMPAQTITWSEHVAPIVYNHCTSCHRPGEIGPFSLTNYNQAYSWGNMIQYVTEIRYMPAWKPDPNYGVKYLKENYLQDDEVALIKAWVDGGMPQGDPALEPSLPQFPSGSQVGTPDLVLSFAQTHMHPGTDYDEYRYFVIPTGLTEKKDLVALEMRPGNTQIVHHALFWADDTGTAAALDAQTPEYGYDGSQVSGGGINNFDDQLPGYVPGVRPHVLNNGIAQQVPANADLVVQIHYAPTTSDEPDSSTFNLFFADKPATRYLQSYIMLPFAGTLENGPFFIYPNQEHEFHGTLTVPSDVSMVGIAPHMHLLGTHWRVYAVKPDGDTIPLVHIPDWDFNWQGGYYFKNLIYLPKNTVIHAFAGYDNTLNNPNNPSNPPKFTTWGESTTDEMYYLPLLFLNYQAGDENLNLEDQSTDTETPLYQFTKTRLYPVRPNPVRGPVNIGFTLGHTHRVQLEVYDLYGRLQQTLIQNQLHAVGEHIQAWDTSHLPAGVYVVSMQVEGQRWAQKVVVP